MHIRLAAIFGLELLISCSSPTIEKQKTVGGDEREELHSNGWWFHYWRQKKGDTIV
jgi:hypothetical protein